MILISLHSEEKMNITLDNLDYTKIQINGFTGLIKDKIDSLTNKDFTFEDFVLYTFVIIDDIYCASRPLGGSRNFSFLYSSRTKTNC